MQFLGDKCDLIQLNSESARLDKSNIAEYLLIYAHTQGRVMDTGIHLHLTQLKALKQYEQFSTTPLMLLEAPMKYFEENGFLVVQKLTSIWEINETKMEI